MESSTGMKMYLITVRKRNRSAINQNIDRNVYGRPVRIWDVLNSNDNVAMEKLNVETTISATDNLNALIS